MSTSVAGPRINLERPRERVARLQASERVKRIKIVCAAALSVGFWYSVPYRTLVQGPEDLRQAAIVAAATNDGAMERQIALPLMCAVAAFLLWRLPRRGRLVGPLGSALLILLGWVAMSVLWSEDPSVTGKRLIVFALDAFLAYTVARVFSVMEMALWGFITTGTVALIALYVDLVQQGIFSLFNPDYRFAGVMQPNYQAMNLVVCILCGLTVILYRCQAMRTIAPLLALAVALLYLTRSRLSAAVCLMLAAVLVFRVARERMTAVTRVMLLLAGLTLVLPAVIYFAGQNAGGAAQSVFMMGRSDTENTSSLSNRAPLWRELWESVEDRPWLGYGYGAFWTAPRLNRVSLDQGWIVPHAHNTYLDETLSLGLVGVLLYAGVLWGSAWIAWRRYRAAPDPASLLPAILLTWLALTGLAESVPLDPYLPTLLAYACLVKMCLAQGSESEGDAELEAGQIIGGLAQASQPQPDFTQQGAR